MANKEDWMGRVGAEWARFEPALDRLLGPAGAAGVEKLAPSLGERILDLGCGAGASSELIAKAVGPDGQVVAIDVSPDLIALAHDRLSDHDNVEIRQEDAQIAEFPRQSFDALYSRFGSMFFNDPAEAFRNLHRALKPGGRAVFVAWQEPARNQWASVPMTFVQEGTTPGVTGPGPGPFAWADPSVFRPILESAGFSSVQENTTEFMAEIALGDDPDPVARAANFLVHIGPMARRMRETSETGRHETAQFLARRLKRHVKDGAVRLLASAWIIEAQA